jgi:hypothetical protein
MKQVAETESLLRPKCAPQQQQAALEQKTDGPEDSETRCDASPFWSRFPKM